MSLRLHATALFGLAICLAASILGPAQAQPGGRWRSVTFDGVSLRVPGSWPVISFSADPTACPRLDRHAVYLGTPGPDPSCPARLLGRTEAVMVERLRPGTWALARPAGRFDRTAADSSPAKLMLTAADLRVTRTLTDALPGARVEVDITYRTNRALALAIQASIRTSPGAGHAQTMRARAAGPASAAGRERAAGRASAAGRERAAGPASAAGRARAARRGLFSGRGFDACAAPSRNAMTQWLASSYRAVGVYIGGINRACAQANLTSSWLSGIVSEGWHYFPIYPGLQSSCVLAFGDATITTSQAGAEGAAAADDAATQAASLRIPHGTPLIYDMEAYAPGCDTQVAAFLSAWDSELHSRGYHAGVYESFTNIGALARAAGAITEPDVIYYADWDGVATTASPYMPAGLWAAHQRIHQYLGGHLETWGGVTIDVDSDQLDAGLGGLRSPASYTGFRVAVAINANGTAEWFARLGTSLVHSWQQPVGALTWSRMHTVGISPTRIASNPAAVAQADGALAVFARNAAGRVEHGWQQAGFPNDWEWGTPLPVPPRPALAGTDPAAILLPGGEVEVLQASAGGGIVVSRQASQDDNAGWTAWAPIGGSCASSPVPVVDSRRNVDVFCVTSAGTAASDTWNGTSWSGWTTLPGSPSDLTGVPCAAVDGSGQTRFFAATASGGLDDAWQDRVGGHWTWGEPLGTSAGSAGTAVLGSPSAATWPAGHIVAYARLANGQVGFIQQRGTTGSAPWTDWSSIGGTAVGGSRGAFIGSPAGWLSTSGAAGVIALGANLDLSAAADTGSGWSQWAQVGRGFPAP